MGEVVLIAYPTFWAAGKRLFAAAALARSLKLVTSGILANAYRAAGH